MGVFRIGIVNGTRAVSDADYDREMRASFCRQTYDLVGETSARYLRGPSNDGLSVRSKAHLIADWITEQRSALRDPFPIYLMGYSRGASVVVYAAEILLQRSVDVEAMFLFDAVALHIWSALGGTTVPRNVKLTMHAARLQDPEMVRRYEGTINGGLGNPMRPMFGNTALKTLGARYHFQPFAGSHGALGGVGWTHVTDNRGHTDEDCQRAVVRFMNSGLKRALGVSLTSYPPTHEPSTGATAQLVGTLDRLAMDPKARLKAAYDALRRRLR